MGALQAQAGFDATKDTERLLTHAADICVIFTDMDGTFLMPDSTLPAQTAAMLAALEETGVRFVPTSGRTLQALQAVFGDAAGRLDFVAGNGMDVISRGQVLRHAEYTHASVAPLVRAAQSISDDIGVIVFEDDASYLFGGPIDFARERIESLRLGAVLDDPAKLPCRPISKLALISMTDAFETSARMEELMGASFVFAPCGHHWTDVLIPGIDKATGIKALLDHQGLSVHQALAFGDSMNDMGMMELIPLSVAVENAMESLASACTFRIGHFSQASVATTCLALAHRRKALGLRASV